MAKLPTIETLRKEFYDVFPSFNYKLYKALVSKRELGGHGLVKASCLVREIAELSAQFMDKEILKTLAFEDVAYCAYMGWMLSYDLLSKNPTDLQIHSALLKATKAILSFYAVQGVSVTKPEIAKLIFICALLKEKLYAKFNYELQGINVDYETGIINVLYKMDLKDVFTSVVKEVHSQV